MATQHNFRIKNGLEVAGTVRITSAGLVTGTTTTQAASDNTTKLASTAYVTTALANLADSAPSTLNTLNELAAALGDDANYSTTTTNAIAAKLPLAGGTLTGALTTNGVINTTTSANFAINTPNSVRINIDSNNDQTGESFIVGNNQTSVNQNNVLFKVQENGNVGIGINTPAQPLSVVKNSNTSNTTPIAVFDTQVAGDYGIVEIDSGADNNYRPSTLRFKEGGNLKWEIGGTYQLVDDTFGIRTTASDYKMVIQANGKVGIGTTAPGSILEIRTDTASGGYGVYPALTIRNDNAAGYGAIHFNEGSTQRARVEVGNGSGTPYMGLYTDSGSSGITIKSGKVGIGTTTPQNNHAKANNLVVGSGSAGGMAVYNGTAEGWYAFSRDNANNTDSYDGGMSYNGNRDLKFHTNSGSVRLKIGGTGDTEIYGNLSFEDNKLLMFGGGQDARLYFDASTNALFITAANGTANTVNITTNNFQIGGATPLISGTANDSVVINQDGASNVDFRVESDNQQYNFFCDASSEIIHFGEGTNSDLLTVTPAGVLNGRRHGYHGGQRQHSGQTFKWCEGVGWTNAIKIDWNNPSWGAVCLRITGMYYYNASNNFSIVIGFAGHSSNGSVSYDATSSGAMNWTSALSLSQTATGETTIAQRAGDTTGDVIYRYEWQCYARSDQEIQIIDL